MDREDKDIEILISRHLDGELSEEEELDLNRRLIRHPEARRLLEGYQRIDSLAAAALKHAVPDREAPFAPATLTTKGKPRRKLRNHRVLWLLPGAIAAALLAVIVNQATLPGTSGPRVAEQAPAQPVPVQVVRPPLEGSNGLMRTVGTTPVPRRQIKRSTARDVYGILGEDGRIYWIEVDRTRTIKRPHAESKYRPVSEEL